MRIRLFLAAATAAFSLSLAHAAEYSSGWSLDKGEVRAIQEALNEAGHRAGPVDGVWGRRTENALRSFQEARGLNVTGDLNENTVLALGFSLEDIEASDARPMVSADQLTPSEVRSIQEALNRAGHKAGPVDGIWGPRTVSALRNFQEAKGLDPTGRLNTDTVLALGFPAGEFAAGEFDE